MRKKAGFSLIEFSIAGALFLMSVLFVQQWIARSSKFLFFNHQVILQKTQNFFSDQNLLTTSDKLLGEIVWKKSAACASNISGATCVEYKIQMENGKTFIWYKYENANKSF
jgi:Tfp pilus assembly protein PilV